jgi:hypothetical protein
VGYIPDNAEWFVAELVEELTVADDPRNIVWRNLTLIRAKLPEEAYQRALALGKGRRHRVFES